MRPSAWSSARTAAARAAAPPDPERAGSAPKLTAVSGHRANVDRLAADTDGR